LKYTNLKFIWVGEGPLIDSLRRQVPENLDISFVGKSDDVEKYYLTGDIYLNFSDLESLGMAVVDAISCGIPCVVNKVGGLTEIIEHNFNGYTFDAFDKANCFIDNLICDSKLRKCMGYNSINHAKKKFSPETQLIKLNKLYNDISNKHL
jgi:glycosyltransferase involved in cell wall biosynthesis